MENLRLVASVMYMLLRRLRPELPELESKRDQMLNSRMAFMSSLGGRGNTQEGVGSRPASNLSATTAGALADGSITSELGSTGGGVFMTNSEIVSQLLPKEYFGFVIYEIDEWLKPYEAMLREWLDKLVDEVVRKILAAQSTIRK